ATYLRCSVESKPAWNGNSRVLFQNNANQRPATTSNSVFSSHRTVEFLRLRFQIKMATEAIATRTIQKGQTFFSASNVPSPPAMELPGPAVVVAAANA